MSYRDPLAQLPTHRVDNQPPPLENISSFALDSALAAGVHREGAGWAHAQLLDFGARTGSAELLNAADLANRHLPQLKTFDRYGQRIDQIEFHPAYHTLLAAGLDAGIHSIAWITTEPRGGHVAHAALEYLLVQCEAGVCCPLTMTYAAVPILGRRPDLAALWLPKLLANDYDPQCLPPAEKSALTFGMAMTEKQGGSDVRTNTTRALDQGDGSYALLGHKWFCSAPMSDAFFTLAQTAQGLSCFMVPRWRPDATRNPIFIQRLKDKLGDRSNASAEIEYHDTFAWLLGYPGDGVKTIIDMVHHTRLDTCVAAAALMRQAFVQATHHTLHRRAFGQRLIEQPLMRNVLADLAIEAEAALVLTLHIAHAYDDAGTNDVSAALARVLVAIGKYWTNRRAPQHIAEALECLGGAGYIEESMLPRLYREAPLNNIWEGSGNVICLDVLRALQRDTLAASALRTLLREAAATDAHIAARVAAIEQVLAQTEPPAMQARWLVETMAVVIQGLLLSRYSIPAVAVAFIETRIKREGGFAYGTLPVHTDCVAIIRRAWPPAADA
ncbi:MAG: acyl-CoA dehydrogenase family protein [Spongiibacteraceae bacterium]